MNFYRIIMIKFQNYLMHRIKINRLKNKCQLDKPNKSASIYCYLKKHYQSSHKNNLIINKKNKLVILKIIMVKLIFLIIIYLIQINHNQFLIDLNRITKFNHLTKIL